MPSKEKDRKKERSGSRKATSSGNPRALVIVESPAKSRTINKILGSGYKVMASMGHIVDLPANKMGIDFDNDFKPEYTVMRGRKKYLNKLKKEAKNSDVIYLAADPDREGEAICWHLKNHLDNGKTDIYRVTFDEITKKAVKEAFAHPRGIDPDKVNAQQARRLLDRIVGYSLSPLLWQKITRGLSAGRVQSVAVKLIVAREEEIRNFVSEEYWSLEASLDKKKNEEEGKRTPFRAKLAKYKGEKIKISDKDAMDGVCEALRASSFVVGDVKKRKKKSHPRSPYITSILQQDAFNKLNFSASKTMRIAQSLYEGRELGEEGSVGLITYMRTDSVRVSDEAREEVKARILEKYGREYYPDKPRVYKSKKRAQEAHECIRPTLPLRAPSSVKEYLSADEYRLYSLIWKRFVSSQMSSAVFSVLTVDIDAGDYRFRAGGGQMIFDGYLVLYENDRREDTGLEDMPPLEKGDDLSLIDLFPEQHFTKPPPRYTDASLVKVLEEKGIGRPSTYAPIIKTVVDRNYIKRLGRSFQPTELGELVNGLLIRNFPDIVDDEFTANMENELDGIEEGKEDYQDLLKKFYSPFMHKLEEARRKMGSVKKQVKKTDEVCEKCGKPMVIKWGRKGRFLSCSDFPNCKFSKSITTGIKCPEEGCEGELVERRSRRGAFYGCTKYPECKYTTRKLPETGEENNGEEKVQED
jgi:DNA topoisomerase-1